MKRLFNDNSGGSAERRALERKLCLLVEYINNCGRNVGRNADDKVHSDEVSDGNEKHVIDNLRKSDPCYKVAENLARLCPTVLWKA